MTTLSQEPGAQGKCSICQTTTTAKCKNYSLCKCFVHDVCARGLFDCFEEGSSVTCYDCTVVCPVMNLMSDTDTNGSGSISSTTTTTTTTAIASTTNTYVRKKRGRRTAPSLLPPKEYGKKRRKEKKDPGRARYSQFLGLIQYLYRNNVNKIAIIKKYYDPIHLMLDEHQIDFDEQAVVLLETITPFDIVRYFNFNMHQFFVNFLLSNFLSSSFFFLIYYFMFKII